MQRSRTGGAVRRALTVLATLAFVALFGLAHASPALAQVQAGDLDVEFSQDRGYYDVPITVELSTPDVDGATIRYSLDSTLPSATEGTIYTGPFTVSATTSVSAVAVSDGVVGEVVTHTFIFADDIASASYMSTSITNHPTWGPQVTESLESIPYVALTFDSRMSTREVPVSFEFHDPSGESIHALAGARHFGQASLNLANTSIRVYFRTTYGPGRLDADLFDGFEYGVDPAERFDKLDVRGGHDTFPGMSINATYVATRFVDGLMTEGGRINPHTRPVFVYLNGDLYGLFTLREAFDDNFLAQYFGNDMDYEYGSYENNGANSGYRTVEGDGSQFAALREAAATGYDEFKQVIGDPNALFDWSIVESYTLFEPEWNVAGNVERGFSFNVNDMDRALWLESSANFGGQPAGLLAALLRHDDYRVNRDFGDRIHCQAYGGQIDPANIVPLYEQLVDDIRLPIIAEAARHGRGTLTPDTWEQRVASRSNVLFSVRSRVITEARRDDLYPEIDPAIVEVDSDGLVEITHDNSAGTLYYTVDGTDPVADNGSVSATAVAYNGPFAVPDGSGPVRARVYDPGQTREWDRWSATCDRWVSTSPGTVGLTINEIHYHPKGDGDSETTEAEFVEFVNAGNTTIKLNQLRVEGGISFYLFDSDSVLGPGEYLVLTDDRDAFQKTYGFEADGLFHRSLSNGGEQIQIVGNGATYDTVTYSDGDGWPSGADGRGPSLELRAGNDASTNDDASAWQLSSPSGGTPGSANSAGLIIGDVDCDDALAGADVHAVLEFLVGARGLADDCWSASGVEISVLGADLDDDDEVGLADAHHLAQCIAAGRATCHSANR